MWQSAAQVKWFGLPPEPKSVPSHCSPGSLTPLPQCSNRQVAEQPLATDGGSHCSTLTPSGLNWTLTMPSPQRGVLQLKLHSAVDTPAESQSSLGSVVRWFLTPSPQNSRLQSCVQPSPSA